MKTLSQERMKQIPGQGSSHRMRRSNTLKALQTKLNDNILIEAHKWLANWELAMNGYCDEMKNNGEPTIPGNLFTFTLLRGKAWIPIKEFWNYAGLQHHIILVQLLVLGWSFAAIGQYNWPALSKSRQKHKAVEQVVKTLTLLHDYAQDKRRRDMERAIAAAQAYKAYPSLAVLCREYDLAEEGMRRLIVRGQKILSSPRIA